MIENFNEFRKKEKLKNAIFHKPFKTKNNTTLCKKMQRVAFWYFYLYTQYQIKIVNTWLKKNYRII